MVKKLARVCPICGNTEGENLHHIQMIIPEDMPIPSQYDVVSCRQCGFCFADVEANQDDYNLYYKNSNDYSQTSDLKQFLTNTIDQSRLVLFEKYISKEARIADMGCGSASFLRCLKKAGYENVFGIDPSIDSINHLKELGLDGAVGNLFDQAQEDLLGKFDVIVFTMVLEHIYDVEKVAPQLKQYVKEGGYIFIDVPASEGFSKYPTMIPNYFNREHINYFDKTSLDNLFLGHGCIRVNKDEESFVDVPLDEANSRFEMYLHGLFQVHGNSNRAIQKSKEGITSINSYFSYMNEKDAVMYSVLDQMFESNESCIVWGTGSLSMYLLANYPGMTEKINYFVDNNTIKVGTSLQGKEIISPEYILKLDSSIPILICSMYNAKDILKQIREMKIPNECYYW